MLTKLLLFSILLFSSSLSFSKKHNQAEYKFRQLDQELPTPNEYRTASGMPGNKYWQQKTDYKIKAKLDEKNNRIYGTVTMKFYNNSPDVLSYLWVQLDQNVRAKNSDSKKIKTSFIKDKVDYKKVKKLLYDFDGGFKIDEIKDINGKKLSTIINKTMMRVDLETPLKPKDTIEFSIKYWYNINDRMEIGGRSGLEYFEKDGNNLYTIAQFYPRMALYTDYEGWQNKQFLGRGEFTLPFGDYDVELTVPDDHILGATGVLQNPEDVLTKEQIQLLEKSKTAKEPIIIVSQKEATKKEKTKSTTYKTWKFKAYNVRDFAFATSRKFIWDAKGVKIGNKNVLAMSYYPKEANPLWEKVSTRAVVHTLKVYSKYSVNYPYPVAISVSGKKIGMEYPMICFNPGRAEEDGTYTEKAKKRAVSVIIHEVGHNFFPMIINSDERQWTWMDEGLNTFLQYITEQEWERNYPSKRGPAYKITNYMKGNKEKMVPIMSNSESILQFGNNAYGKPATALNILRETVMGRDLFDFSFKEYSKRWAFKHPTPADFFRTMEDASAVDLDWFWRGWFYGTDHVDVSIENVKSFQINSKDPKIEKPFNKKKDYEEDVFISNKRNKKEIEKTYDEADLKARDFYTTYDKHNVFPEDLEDFDKEMKKEENKNLKSLLKNRGYFHEVTFYNKGGLISPLIIKLEFIDGSEKIERIPAEIWLKNDKKIKKLFVSQKKLKSVSIDPFLETADTDVNNNHWPREIEISKFEIFEKKKEEENSMKKYGQKQK